jgi:hypothetical protein
MNRDRRARSVASEVSPLSLTVKAHMKHRDHLRMLLPSKVTFGSGTTGGEWVVAMEEGLLLFLFLLSSFFCDRMETSRLCYKAKPRPNQSRPRSRGGLRQIRSGVAG